MLCAAALVVGCAHTPPPPAQASGVTSPSPPTAPSVVNAMPTLPTAPALPAPGSQTSTPATNDAVRGAPALDARQVATSEALTPSGRSRYACEQQGALTEIQLPEGSGRICSRFPAMGPCQYERNACRARGGRVIRFDGVEITRDVEREYDKQVQRFRLNAG
ncbi:MAG: hypothetical protein EAZ21_02805 [Betaproteobacteria bacterium]|nr:MAG: hypothetical protein EAZ21_02805 [Betaproteobacteria bacterium]